MKKILSILLLSIFVISCTQIQDSTYIELNGRAQGTTYQIKYEAPNGKNFKDDIEAIFKRIDLSMSTYVPTSLISTVNKGDTLVHVDTLFLEVLDRSIEIANESNGDFDPTIGPLVSLWGFGFEEVRQDVNREMVNDRLERVGYKQIEIKGDSVRIPEGFQIDFHAIAQGYTVDYIADYLEGYEVTNYMVEVGGEVRARGVNQKGEVWRIGVDKPSEEIDPEGRFQFILELENKALATSGSYRKFWVDEETGERYSHTIDPKTGYPARNRLLSVSIISGSSMDADAYATVCMVRGVEGCKEFLNSKDNLEGYLVYDVDPGNWTTFTTEGFEQYIVN
ncbi:FAD:protein FMN transferase [Gracilimonas amylolytica]|uniref:FAD:protein FMN transferase n=1 Tax=Gracilimonas amylolytica TaxID=1749045 RepID=UPI000CD9E6AD|nr:FAD:protein FMN transferase [Gracilimonas amylolytica]